MNVSTWSDLIDSLYDPNHERNHPVPGTFLDEWLHLVNSDYDEIDAIYIDHETQGGD